MSARSAARVRIGISGWTYKPWRGNFYPKGLAQRHELAYASRRFSAIEINGTFYSLQQPSSFRTWYNQTPPDFVFAIKGGRFITHFRKLREPRVPLANFFASGLLGLREKLGPILWQFPPFMPFNEDRFKEFFDLLPRDTRELARLAREHDSPRRRPVELEVDENRPVRHAVEFRHESFLTDRFTTLLARHNIALVVADVASKFPTAEDVTADWVYVRLHGSRQLYASGYTPREIKAWAQKVRAWHEGRQPTNARLIDPDGQSVSKSGKKPGGSLSDTAEGNTRSKAGGEAGGSIDGSLHRTTGPKPEANAGGDMGRNSSAVSERDSVRSSGRGGGRASARQKRDVFVFFDNTDVKLRAPVDARRMMKELGLGPDDTPRAILTELEGEVR